MKCEICNRGIEDSVNLWRVNPKGQPGVWRCDEHLIKQQREQIHLEVVDLVDAIASPTTCNENTVGCSFAGPGRGDCSHFIGLPGTSINGCYTDTYGKPNGWCWSCWKDEKLKTKEIECNELQAERDSARRELEQLKKDKKLLLKIADTILEADVWIHGFGHLRGELVKLAKAAMRKESE